MTDPTRTVLADGAVEYRDSQGNLHRLDGPARTHADGRTEWWQYGQRHRTDGPAVVYPDGRTEQWINGARLYGVRSADHDHEPGSTRFEYAVGSVSFEYRDADGKPHRTVGPARVWADGAECWYRHGLLHRVDGPATTHPGGYEAWHFNGDLHRVDGPAVSYPDGVTEWWVDGVHRYDLKQEANKDD